MSMLLLVLLALAPPVFFLICILRHDRIEREPRRFVLKVFIIGVLSVVPAAIIELALLEAPMFLGEGFGPAALQSFLVISPIEESVKLAVVLLFVWRSRHFNERNDGIVYAGTASIGFAAAENLLYVLLHGFGVGMARAVTSIPMHTFTGVVMGHFTGRARFAPSRGVRNGFLAAGLGLAWLSHGAYDSFVLSGTAAVILVVPVVVINFVVGISILKKGQAGSAIQWGQKQVEPPMFKPARPGVKRIIGRTLLTVSGLFWLLMIAGFVQDSTEGAAETVQTLLGGIVLTAVPIAVGVVLELSARKAVSSGKGDSA